MEQQKIRTYQTNLNLPEGFPTGVWDPSWEQHEVATRVAVETYRRIRHLPFDHCTLLDDDDLPDYSARNTEKRTFPLDALHQDQALKVGFRGGSYGEIFKRYSFGPRPAANFHAQAVMFGVDSEGRFFVEATVGLVGGTLDNEGALVVRFAGPDGVIGGVAWEGAIQNEKNVKLQILGTDERLKNSFDRLSEAQIDFYARCPGA